MFSFWTAIWEKLKEIINNMIGGSKTIEQTLHVTPVISSEMEQAIEMWGNMYKGKAEWLHEPTFQDPARVVSLGLPALISSEMARTALLEFQSEITTPTKEIEVDNPDYTEPQVDEFGNIIPSVQPPTIIEEKVTGPTDRAEYLNEQYEKLKSQLRKQLEYAIAKGGLVIKPYVVVNNDPDVDTTMDMEFDFIQADSFYPLAFNAAGKITEAAFLQTKADKNTTYRRLEYHKWEKNKVTIINKAYKQQNNSMNMENTSGLDLGKEIPLTEVPEWAELQPKVTVNNVVKPLFAYFKMPQANTIDTTSPLGVSGFSRAVSLIKDADLQYSRLLWEYEGGELAIDIDRDALRTVEGADGKLHTVANTLQQRLFRNVDLGSEGDTYQPYAPALRDASYNAGLNAILMRIEDACGISRGTLSDVTQEAKTATEITMLKQRSYQTNAEIQQSLENTLKDVIYIMDVYCDLYEITPDGDYDTSFEWDDSIIVDVNEELNKRLTLFQNGLTSKVEMRMWYFGETERQAKEALTKIAEENQVQMEQDLAMQSNLNRPQEMEVE